jgi:hypothetical protein
LILIPIKIKKTFFLDLSNGSSPLKSLTTGQIHELKFASDEFILALLGLHFDEDDENGVGPGR